MATLYRPLDEATQEIRLFRFVPDSKSPSSEGYGRIQCNLEHHALHLNPKYHALSYTWDLDDQVTSSQFDSQMREDVEKKIFLNGTIVTVAPNLWDAMNHFRSDPDLANMLVWVDALCINQADIEERNKQVWRMRAIYQCAQQVQVWLGAEANNSGLGMRLICEYSFTLTIAKMFSPNRTLRELSKSWIADAMNDPTRDAALHAVGALYRRAYWTRMWIVQEILANARVRVLCGEEKTLLKPLLDFGDSICEMASDPDEYILEGNADSSRASKVSNALYIPCRWTPHLYKHKMNYKNYSYEGLELDDLLFYYRSQRAKLPHDKIYGLLGLLHATTSNSMAIDYNSSVEACYKAATQYIIRGPKRLDYLCMAGIPACTCDERDHQALILPSWVPNWSCDKPHRNLLFDISGAQSNAFQQYPPMRKECLLPGGNSDVLICIGLDIGCIRSISHAVDDEQIAENPYMRLKELIDFVLKNACLLQDEDDEAAFEGFRNVNALYEILFLTRGIDRMVEEIFPKAKFFELYLLWSEAESEGRNATWDKSWWDATRAVDNCLRGRSIFATVVNYEKDPEPSLTIAHGICSPAALVGDRIVVLRGCRYPVLLRERAGSPGTWTYIKEVYLHEFMYGEVVGDESFDEKEYPIY